MFRSLSLPHCTFSIPSRPILPSDRAAEEDLLSRLSDEQQEQIAEDFGSNEDGQVTADPLWGGRLNEGADRWTGGRLIFKGELGRVWRLEKKSGSPVP